MNLVQQNGISQNGISQLDVAPSNFTEYYFRFRLPNYLDLQHIAIFYQTVSFNFT